MKITRRDLSAAATSSLPLFTFLGILSGIRHHDARLGAAFVALECGPLLGVRLLLALPRDLRITRRSLPTYAAFATTVALWIWAAKITADMQGVPQADRLAFALQTVALFGVFTLVILGMNLWFQARARRARKPGGS